MAHEVPMKEAAGTQKPLAPVPLSQQTLNRGEATLYPPGMLEYCQLL